jgi:hypothetical protein
LARKRQTVANPTQLQVTGNLAGRAGFNEDSVETTGGMFLAQAFVGRD